jgi:hypothetical protein
MSNITILRPTWKSAVTAKSFALEESTRRPKLTSEYELGLKFTYATTEVKTISDLYSLLARCADKKVIRIYGRPVKGLGKIAYRRMTDFECEDTNLLMIDADSWPVPEGFSLGTKEGIYKTVNEILVNRMGLEALKGVQFCCLLSSSMWSKDKLRAHLYFLLDEPITLKSLHDWGFNHNSLNGVYKIDYRSFHSIQPDYISRRVCQGFNDPLPGSLRLTEHCDHLSPYVRKAELDGLIQDIEQKTSSGTTNTLVSKIPIGATWEKTLALCGTQTHGINEPTYRACAQLVQEVGDSSVTSDLVYHVNNVYTKMWANITKHGVRGSKEDRDRYTREKIKGYLQTAVKKKFGEQSDLQVQEVTNAIEAIKNGGNSSLLFDRSCLDAIRHLKAKMPERWVDVRSTIKRELKTKVSIADLEKAASDLGDKLDPELMVESLIDQFKWIQGENDNCLYCMIENGDKYKLISLDEGVEEEIYARAFGLYGGKLPFQFERTVLRILVSRKDDPIYNPFKRYPVENRCYSTVVNGKNTTYYNLGSTLQGEMRTAVICEKGVKVIPSQTAPVLWRYSTNTLVAEVDDFTEQIETLGEMGKMLYIDNYLEGIREFTTVVDDLDLLELIAWQTVATVNTGTANLLQITGRSEDGKSSTAVFTKELCDPTSADIKEGPDLHNGLYKKEDLAKTLRNRHVTVFDNLSGIAPRDQDMLCSIATGWRYDLRVLYSQRYLDLIIKKPLVLTALLAVTTNQDLRSRTITVAVTSDMKNCKGDLYAKWVKESPRMRIGLMFFVSRVIARVNRLREKNRDLNDRSLWSDQARMEAALLMKAYPNVDKMSEKALARKVGERKRFENANEAILNSTTSLVIAWICNDPIFIKRREVFLDTNECYIYYRRFVNENAGKIVNASGFSIEIAPAHMVKTVRSLGTRLGVAARDIQLVTGRRVINTKEENRRGWKFYPQNLEEVEV